MSASIIYMMRNRKFDILHPRWADNLARVKQALQAGDQARALAFASEIERGARYAQCRDVMDAATIVRFVAIVSRANTAP